MEIKLNYLELENDEIYQNQEHNSFYCFHIRDRQKKVEWRICCHNELLEQRQQRIRDFRNELIKRVLQKLESMKGIDIDQQVVIQSNYDKDGLKENDIDDQNDYDSNIMKEWNYNEQSSWAGNCQNDKIQQSPVSLAKYKENQSSSQLQIQFDYKLTTFTKIRNQQEYYLEGDLGEIIFNNLVENQELKQKYCGFRIELKFGSEHQIDRNKVQLEVVVYHTLKIGGQQCMGGKKVITQRQEEQQLNDMADLIVSFLITTDSSQLQQTVLDDQVNIRMDKDNDIEVIESGVFLNELSQTESSENIQTVYGMSRLMNSLNLMDIAIGRLDGTVFKKSFVYYTGTLSKPSCQQTKRIVMTQKIYIDKQSYLNLQQKYSLDKIPNTRMIQKKNPDLEFYYHKDISQQCSSRLLQLEIKKKIQNLKAQDQKYNQYNEEIHRLQKYLKTVEKLGHLISDEREEKLAGQGSIRQMIQQKQAVIYKAQTEVCQLMLVKKTRADSIFPNQNMEINNSNAELSITRIDVTNRRDLNDKLNQLKEMGYCEEQIEALRTRLPKESDGDIYEIQDMRPKYKQPSNYQTSSSQNSEEQSTKNRKERFHVKNQIEEQQIRFRKQ